MLCVVCLKTRWIKERALCRVTPWTEALDNIEARMRFITLQ